MASRHLRHRLWVILIGVAVALTLGNGLPRGVMICCETDGRVAIEFSGSSCCADEVMVADDSTPASTPCPDCVDTFLPHLIAHPSLPVTSPPTASVFVVVSYDLLPAVSRAAPIRFRNRVDDGPPPLAHLKTIVLRC